MYLFKLKWTEEHEFETWAKDEEEAVRLSELETKVCSTLVRADLKEVQVLDKEESSDDYSYNDEDFESDPFECE